MTAPPAEAERTADAGLPAFDPPGPIRGGGARSVSGTHGIVTSVEAQATRAGIRILERGGNAVDAAVAVAYALAVTHPSAGNIGGGGFMLVKLKDRPTVAIDFRETAPAALDNAHFDQLVFHKGIGAAAVGVPGSVAGLNLALEHFGRLPRKTVLGPAIELAARGHRVGQREADTLRWSWAALRRDPGARRTFTRDSSQDPVEAGALLPRPDLARTLRSIADEGDAGFYRGRVASTLVSFVQRRHGLLTEADLANYRAVVREPLRVHYRGLTVEVMPPPSAGGVVVVELLAMLEALRAYRLERQSPEQLHLFIEASRRAQAERRFAIVDPDSLGAADLLARQAQWTDPHYLLDKPPTIDPAHATPSEQVSPLFAAALHELEHTTHFAVIDGEGNVVSCTTTLSAGFGAKLLVPQIGVILNNSVASFSTVGENLPTPSRRTISSMAPTLVLDHGRPLLVLGTPGGDTIPSTIVQVLRNIIDYGMTLEDAVDAPRIHHGFVPDEVRLEPRNRPARSVLGGLVQMGHHLSKRSLPMGDANSIVIAGERAFGYADRREGGIALAARAPRSAQ